MVMTRAVINPVESAERERRCETCGNEYDKAFVVELGGERHVFDCFECAIHALAPICEHCGCRIVGHGVEARERIYCCGHCAHASGEESIVDRAEHAP
jgi:hypothetical protein